MAFPCCKASGGAGGSPATGKGWAPTPAGGCSSSRGVRAGAGVRGPAVVGEEAPDRLSTLWWISVCGTGGWGVFCPSSGGLRGVLPQLLGADPVPSRQGCSSCAEEPCLPFTRGLLHFGCWGHVVAYPKVEGTREMQNGKRLLFSTLALLVGRGPWGWQLGWSWVMLGLPCWRSWKERLLAPRGWYLSAELVEAGPFSSRWMLWANCVREELFILRRSRSLASYVGLEKDDILGCQRYQSGPRTDVTLKWLTVKPVSNLSCARLALALASNAESRAQSPLVFHLKNIHSET